MSIKLLQRGTRTNHQTALNEVALAVKINCLKTLVHAFLAEVDHIEHTRRLESRGLLNLREEVRRFELNLISSALKQAGSDSRLAARLLGIHVNTLNSKV